MLQKYIKEACEKIDKEFAEVVIPMLKVQSEEENKKLEIDQKMAEAIAARLNIVGEVVVHYRDRNNNITSVEMDIAHLIKQILNAEDGILKDNEWLERYFRHKNIRESLV